MRLRKISTLTNVHKQVQLVAEGVETQVNLEQLTAMGCDLAQGYLFARPLTAEDATALLSEHRRLGVGFAA